MSLISYVNQAAALAAALQQGVDADKAVLRAALQTVDAAVAALAALDFPAPPALTAAGMPDGIAQAKISGLTAALSALSAQIAAMVPAALRNLPNGWAGLDAGGHLDPGVLPAIQDQTTRLTVSDDAARLGLPASAGFRIVLVTATGLRWSINPGADPASPANWDAWADSAAGVDTFNGRAGAVTAQSGDYAAAQIAASPGGMLAGVTVAAQLVELATVLALAAARLDAAEADLDLLTDGAVASDTRLTALESVGPSLTLSSAAPSAALISAGANAATAGAATQAARADHNHDVRLDLIAGGTFSAAAAKVLALRQVVVAGQPDQWVPTLVALSDFLTGRTYASGVYQGGTFGDPRVKGVKYTNRPVVLASTAPLVGGVRTHAMSGVSGGNVQLVTLDHDLHLILPDLTSGISDGETYRLEIGVRRTDSFAALTISAPGSAELRWGSFYDPDPDGAVESWSWYVVRHARPSNVYYIQRV